MRVYLIELLGRCNDAVRLGAGHPGIRSWGSGTRGSGTVALRVHEVGVPYRDQFAVLVPVDPSTNRHGRPPREPGVGLLGDVHIEPPYPDPVAVADLPEVAGVVAGPVHVDTREPPSPPTLRVGHGANFGVRPAPSR